MNATAYVYDESNSKCLFVVTGERPNVEWEIAAHFEQNGYPSTFTREFVNSIESAEVMEV